MKKILFIGDDLFGSIQQLKEDVRKIGEYETSISAEKLVEFERVMCKGGAFLVHRADDNSTISGIWNNAKVARTFEEVVAEIEKNEYDHYVVDLNFNCESEFSKDELRKIIGSANLATLSGLEYVDSCGGHRMLGTMKSEWYEEHMTQFGVLIVEKLQKMGLGEKVTIFTADFNHATLPLALLAGTGLVTVEEVKSLAATSYEDYRNLAAGKFHELLRSINGKIVMGGKSAPEVWQTLIKQICR